jgi:hypothetical protein
LHRTPRTKAPPEPVEVADVRADWGIDGDRHARPGSSRQVVLTQHEVLDELQLAPGATREQLTVSGLGALAAGDVLELGVAPVRLELVRPRVPCGVMNKVRPGLMKELQGRGGWCARVVAGGELRRGDVVTVLPAGSDAPGATADPPWLADYRLALARWEASPPTRGDGWTSFGDRFAHLIAWDERAAGRIADPSASSAATDIDAFNAHAVERLRGKHLWDLHDQWSTAVLDAARRWPDRAEPWLRTLADHYRDHTP